jgi:hypothetical protein
MPQTLPTKALIHSYEREVLTFELTEAPSEPSAGDSHLVGRGATGPWYLKDDCVATLNDDDVWEFMTPVGGLRLRLIGSADWVEYSETKRCWEMSGNLGISASGLTASTTQTQGQLPLAHEINVIATCVNANDACTLPPAFPGRMVFVANDGAQTLQVFPASGGKIDAGVADASTTIAAAKRRRFYAIDSVTWKSMLGA